jgi:hypothetical protein
VEFVNDKVALGHVFPEYFNFASQFSLYSVLVIMCKLALIVADVLPHPLNKKKSRILVASHESKNSEPKSDGC